MQECQINTDNVAQDGICNNSIRLAAQNQFQENNTFINCQDKNFTYNLTINGGNYGMLNGTMLFIVDNSGLLTNTTTPSTLINLILSYEVIAEVNQ